MCIFSLFNMDFNQITSFKGNQSWFQRGGYFFVVYRTRHNKRYLKCSSNGCRAKWTLSADGVEASAVLPGHDHDPTPWVLSRNEMFQALKRRASDLMELGATCLSIYQEEVLRHPLGAAHLPFTQVESSMRKWRKDVLPPAPRTLMELAQALRDHDQLNNLFLATVEAGNAVAVILVMPQFGEILRESTTIFADGTFATVPAGLPAYQILTIHATVAGYYFHPVLVLMQNRTRALYEAVLRRIWEAAGNPQPEHIVTDFEPALQGALQSVAHMQVQGCLFHYLQALLRRAQRLGLPTRHNSPGGQLVRLYGALALLPAEQVALGLAEVPAMAAANDLPYSEEFHQYFNNHWMARVGPATFSVCGSPHQTTNVAESFHSTLKKSLGPHPNIWQFTGFVRKTFGYCESRRAAIAIGNPPRRTRVKNYARHEAQRAALRDLGLGRITIREFLEATCQLMARVLFPVWEIVEDVPEVANEVVLGAEAEREPELVIEVPAAPAQPAVVEPEVPVAAAQLAVVQVEVPAAAAELPRGPAAPPVPELAADAPDRVGLCEICTQNISNRVFVPCGHSLCADCLRGVVQARDDELLPQCPFCRARYERAIHLYI